MPDIYCNGCHKRFWWYDNNIEYCNNCKEKNQKIIKINGENKSDIKPYSVYLYNLNEE